MLTVRLDALIIDQCVVLAAACAVGRGTASCASSGAYIAGTRSHNHVSSVRTGLIAPVAVEVVAASTYCTVLGGTAGDTLLWADCAVFGIAEEVRGRAHVVTGCNRRRAVGIDVE